jgi:hypothetical protein
MSFRHTTITVDGRCIDLLLTDDEISTGLERALVTENQKFMDAEKCCGCWPVNPPPECPFWRRILGVCRECEQ